MSHHLNRVKVSVATTGTGTVTPGSAVSNARLSFAQAGAKDGMSIAYMLEEGSDFELGRGTYTAAGGVTRDTVLMSRIGGTVGTTKMTLAGAATLSVTLMADELREKITANRTYYVRTGGNDSNGGLVNDDSNAFASMNGAMAVIKKLDFNGFNVTMQLQSATWTSRFDVEPWFGHGNLILDGGGGTLGVSGNIGVRTVEGTGGEGNNLVVQNITFNCLLHMVINAGNVIIGSNVTFDSSDVSQILVSGLYGKAFLGFYSAYAISGGGSSHVVAGHGAYVDYFPGTVTCSNTPQFGFEDAEAFITVLQGGYVSTSGVTFSGAVKGRRFYVASGGNLDGASDTYWPGDITGKVDGAGYVSWDTTRGVPRERLAAERSYYVRADLGTVSLSIGSPCVATLEDHGLQADDPIVFTCPFDMGDDDNTGTACVTFNASTDMLTFNNNGFANGDPIKLHTSGVLPTGLSPDTQYFVVNKSGSHDFQVSLTSGGAAVTFTGSATGLCRVRRDSWLPDNVDEGRVYYVRSNDLTDDTFKFSETQGGGSVNSSGTTAGKIRVATGNDSNTGRAQNRAEALLTVNEGLDRVLELDLNNKVVNLFLSDGLYLPDASGTYAGTIFHLEGQNPSPGNARQTMAVGTGHLMVWGNEVSRNQVRLSNFGGNNFQPIIQTGWTPFTVNFRKFAVMGGYVSGAALSHSGRGTHCYTEHLSFWGDISGSLYEYTNYGIGFLHGMTEIYGNPGTMVSAFGGAEAFYLSFGQDYFGGVIAFKPQTGVVASAGNENSIVTIVNTIKFEGDYSGAKPWSLFPGGLVEHARFDTFWGEQLPGGVAPDFRAGGIYTYRDSNLPSGVGQYFAHAHYTVLHQRPYTVALLPTVAEGMMIGSRAMVSDASSPTFGATVAGGGSTLTPVYWDGTNWKVG